MNRRLIAGGTLLVASMVLVHAGNYLFNLILSRWLGPAAFSDLSLIVTLWLLVTLVTTTVQLLAARFAAGYVADEDFPALGGLRGWLLTRAWLAGGAMAATFVLGAPLLSDFFQTESAWPFVIIGAGLPVFIAQGVERGVLQGQAAYGRLSLSYLVEMVVRLAVGVGLVAAGFGLVGAAIGLTLSFFASRAVTARACRDLDSSIGLPALERERARAFIGPVAILLIGEALINQGDTLLVKHLFEPEQAGLYAAVALAGRMVFFATWAIGQAIFPIVAQRAGRGEPHRRIFWAAAALVGGSSAVLTLLGAAMPSEAVTLLFGPEYEGAAPLIWPYAAAVGLFSLTNLALSYELAAGYRSGAWMAVLAGVIQVIAISAGASTLEAVVMIQVVLMGALAAAVLGRGLLFGAWAAPQPASSRPA